jgi:heme exporter protein A
MRSPWASPSPTSPAPAAAAWCCRGSASRWTTARRWSSAVRTALLRALAGLLPADGRVELDGRRLDRDARAEAVGYAGHLDAVKPQLGVGENLAFWAGLFGGDPDLGLAAFGLAEIADRPAHLLSAGQKRRLGLARLLLAPRRLWLLDEPTVSLDAAAVSALLAAVGAHTAAGGLAVVATHAPFALPLTRELMLAAEAASRAASAADPFLAGWG